MSINEAELRSWVGRRRTMVDDLHPFPARALAAALGRQVPIEAGDELPLTWQWLYFLDTPNANATGPDGHPKSGEFLPPAPLPRRMWAAGHARMEQPLRIGRRAVRESTIKSIDVKHGKTGELVFVNLEHLISQDGKTCIQEEQNLVYREMPATATLLPPGEPPQEVVDWTEQRAVDPILLFRYSALTYNGHRIHYDRPYAIEREFYPSLVVQGPLLATLLMELTQARLPSHRVADVAELRFRAVRPTFDEDAISLAGHREGNRLNLWSAQNGQICMKAAVTLR